MNIPIFELERVQSLFENTVDYNLTESGFHPYTLKELLSAEQLEVLSNTVLGYGQTNGAIFLRESISAIYEGVDKDNVLVTNGSSEANFVACHTLLDKGDEVVMMVPNYMQIWGIAEEMGCIPKAFHLKEENNWAPDLEELRSKVTPKTKMIAICNPNNPTGYTLNKEEMDEIVSIAQSVNAWIFSDEVYRGAELDGNTIPSFIGLYDKVMVNGGLSKAYALPGLRLGWLVGPKDSIEDAWAYHDYTSITAGIMSHYIGEIALQPKKRAEILDRNRNMLSENLKEVKQWLDQYGDLFEYVEPKAGGMLFIKYNLDINSTELAEWLRKEKSVFIVAGDCYGMDHYFRIGIGERKEYILSGLDRIKDALKDRFGL
ncbi:MAG: aminotransferase class I/II-fold pyridoxal phosphate-dependent enzyme [Balneolaceae bacterium]|nr:aminotransferase class I/II-fold pyridoxal phosphate-dependent enzyme [Balneolaceae bacterium]MBO6547798.1 aminotransferase class I/II-fold pyridoxal phosphate-dependent enzyme [Balneolaceae bacterium]MBO6648309.1 aminotransferase class I/II-fold pyridoxal phosphate-dependent enzyme [Balneolaceae bacterium]